MGVIFGKESQGLYSALFIPDPGKRKAALDRWVDETTPTIQVAVKEELQELIELVTKYRRSDEGWR